MSAPRPKILIVDKNDGGSFLLMSVLKDWGFETFSVNSFLKAIDYCKTNYTPDLVIVEMQGAAEVFYEFPRKLRERTGKAPPIVVHSRIADREVIEKAIRSGYTDFLVRPVEPEVLHDKLSDLLEPSHALNASTFKFQLNEEARLSLPIHIATINEFGIQGHAPFAPPSGVVVEITSPTLEQNGLPPLKVKVVSVVPGAVDNQVKLGFIGLTGKELTKLRRLAMFKGDAA